MYVIIFIKIFQIDIFESTYPLIFEAKMLLLIKWLIKTASLIKYLFVWIKEECFIQKDQEIEIEEKVILVCNWHKTLQNTVKFKIEMCINICVYF